MKLIKFQTYLFYNIINILNIIRNCYYIYDIKKYFFIKNYVNEKMFKIRK